MRTLIFFSTLIAMVALMAPSCPNGFVNITYHQVGACNGGATPDGEYNAGPNQAYVVFAIERIDNTQNQNAFAYDPRKIAWTLNTNDAFDANLEIYQEIFGPFATVPTTVNAKTSMGFNPYGYGALVVQTVAQDGASEAASTSYFLSYKGSGSPGNPFVLMTKSNSSQTNWPYTPNCADIILQKK
jgi:hypothetical protein